MNFYQGLTTQNLKQKIEEYHPDAAGTTDQAKFHKINKTFFKTKRLQRDALKVFKVIYAIYETHYPNRNTLCKRLYQIRKVVKENQTKSIYQKSTFEEYFNIPKSETQARAQAYMEKVKERHEAPTKINKTKILEMIATLIKSSDVYERAVALLLASGLRPVELFSRVGFTRVKGNPKWVEISGLAKKGAGQVDTNKRPLIVLDLKTFIRGAASLRSSIDRDLEDEDGQLTTYISKRLSAKIKELFPKFKSNKRASMLRKIYANLSFDLFGTGSNLNIWVAEVLGHDALNLTTSFSYSNIDMTDSEDSEEEEKEEELTKVQKNRLLKMQKLESLWVSGMTNAELRKKSGIGSRLVNQFLKMKAP